MISTHNLSVGYSTPSGERILFDDLQLSIPAGELICFMGSNGVGKTSLIRTLAGLQPPMAGTITGRTSNNIALVLTDKLAPSNLSVYDLVSFGRYPYIGWSLSLQAKDVELVEQAIDLVNIRVLINKKLFELSDGQLQMALIAKALAQDAPVLLLDEPTAHLDLNNRVEIMNLLRKISREQNKAILVATHELDLALQTSDTIWLACPDKKIKTGIPEDLVLDGSFDEVFQFKGFDLKTGKVFHEPFRNMSVQLVGEGHEFLWTKNALERNGFSVSQSVSIQIFIKKKGNSPLWELNLNGKQEFVSLNSMLKSLINGT